MSNNFKYYAPFFKNYTGKEPSFLQVNDGNQSEMASALNFFRNIP
jgi:hypothetical protein